MGRRSKREQIVKAVRRYIEVAEHRTPDRYPLEVKTVAQSIGCSRTLLYKYDLAAEIQAASGRQRARLGLTTDSQGRRSLADVVTKLRAELALADKRNKALIARLNVVEANAARLGINPEELYREMVRPDRSRAHTRGRLPRPRG